MNDVIELENVLDDAGFRVLHLMANVELGFEHLKTYGVPDDAPYEAKKEAGVWHLRSRWLVCGPVRINAEGWPTPKQFVIWNLSLTDSVKAAMFEANRMFEDVFLERAQYAFIRNMPRGIESGVEVGNLMLFEAEWMIRKCVAVGYLYQ